MYVRARYLCYLGHRPYLCFMPESFVSTCVFIVLSPLRPCAGTIRKRNTCFGARFTHAPAISPSGWTLFVATNAVESARQGYDQLFKTRSSRRLWTPCWKRRFTSEQSLHNRQHSKTGLLARFVGGGCCDGCCTVMEYCSAKIDVCTRVRVTLGRRAKIIRRPGQGRLG